LNLIYFCKHLEEQKEYASTVQSSQSCIFDDLVKNFIVIHDPRVKNRCDHLLVDVMIIGVTSVLCGAESWEEIGEFAKHRQEWFEKFLELPNGVPSHDTIARVFSLIDAAEFERVFTGWATSVLTMRDSALQNKNTEPFPLKVYETRHSRTMARWNTAF